VIQDTLVILVVEIQVILVILVMVILDIQVIQGILVILELFWFLEVHGLTILQHLQIIK
jgi:hypothetical protein